MSTLDETPSEAPSLTPTKDSPTLTLSTAGTIGDVLLWKEKKTSLLVLGVSTALWVLLDCLGFTLLTVASWVGIATLTTLFLWANLAPLFGRDPPDQLFEWEVSEDAAVTKANVIREWIERSSKWLTHRFLLQRDWVLLGKFVFGLLLTAWFSSKMDLLTLVYLGIFLGLTCSPIYVKYEDRMKEWSSKVKDWTVPWMDNAKRIGQEWMKKVKGTGRRWHNLFNEKVWGRVWKKTE